MSANQICGSKLGFSSRQVMDAGCLKGGQLKGGHLKIISRGEFSQIGVVKTPLSVNHGFARVTPAIFVIFVIFVI